MKDKLIEIALKRMTNTQSQGKRINWQRVQEDYNNTFSTNKTTEEIRNEIYSVKTLDELKELKDNATYKEENYRDKISYNEDGSILYDKLITLHENDVNSKETVIKAFSLDYKEWTVINMELNLWSVASKKKRLNNYQAKVRVRPKEVKDLTPDDVARSINDIKPREAIKYEYKKTGKTLALYITDKHIGSSMFDSYHYMKMVQEVKRDLKFFDIEKFVLVLLGDILHVDNTNNTTVRGTQLITSMDAFDMLDEADSLVIHLIEELAIIPSEIYWVQGNHSRGLEYSLFKGVERYFKNSKHIKFNVDKTIRKAFKIYDTFIGIHHGDMPKANMYDWAHFVFADLWGTSNRWELHTGDKHNKDVTTKGGLTHTQHGIQTLQSDYENTLGYYNFWLRCEAYVYDEEVGNQYTIRY